MTDQRVSYRSFPADLKYGLYCLSCGWIAIYGFAYLITISQKTMILLLGLGVISCYSLVKVNEWARRLTIAGDIIIVVSFILFAAVLWKNKTDLALLALIIVIAFGLATYFLLTRATSAFFKAATPRRDVETKP